MRTTLTLDDDLLRAAKRKAANDDRPLKEVIGEALRIGLAAMEGRPAGASTFKLKVVGGQGLQPGIRLDDRDALFDLLDEA